MALILLARDLCEPSMESRGGWVELSSNPENWTRRFWTCSPSETHSTWTRALRSGKMGSLDDLLLVVVREVMGRLLLLL